MVVQGEASALGSVEVLAGVPTIVEVDLCLVVGIQRSEQSVPCAFFLVFAQLVRLILGVVLLEHLLVHHGVVLGALLHHGRLWLQVWTSVILVLHWRVVSVETCEGETTDEHCNASVSPEVFPGSSCSIDIWPVMDPSLNRADGDSSLRDSSSSANKHGKWPGKCCTNEEVDDPLSPVVVSELSIVFPWNSLWVGHELPWSHG